MTLIYIFVFLFGLIIGSFLNCSIWRLYKNQTILGRSYCPRCHKTIHWYDNIPLLSFILLKGRCRFCKKKISWQYPLVELITGLLFLLAFYLNFISDFSIIKLIFAFVFISLAIIIFVFDIRWYLIPIPIVVCGALFFLIINLILGYSILTMLITVIVGVSFFLLQYLFSILIMKKEGLGEGDIWLGGFFALAFPVLGQFIGFLFLTYLIGGLIAVILLIFGLKGFYSKVPLGVFLSLSGIIMLFWGNQLVNWYLNLIF
ncbi:MAG TPA: prepilin peptidase [bacterium]|nr:prepilin peptidase [bacterium]